MFRYAAVPLPALILATVPAIAQQSAENHIIVTASRSGATLEELPISVSLIEEERLAAQLEFSTNILRSIEFAAPGLSPQGEGRSGCFVGIRGRQTSIQINGIPVNQDLRQSNCNGIFQISPFALERVEVVRGGSALYGAGSPGGIINLITRRARGRQLEVDLTAQTSFDTSNSDDTFTTDLYAGAGQNFGAWDYYFGAGYTNAGARRTPDGGFVPFRTYENISLNGAIGVELLDGDLRLTGTFYRETPDQEYAADGTQVAGQRFANVVPISAHPQIDQAADRLFTLALSYIHPDVLGQELTTSLFYQDQRYRQRDNFFDIRFGGDFFFATNQENQRFGFRSALVKRFAAGRVDGRLSYGFDFTRNRFYRPTVDPAQAQRIINFIAPETILETYALFGQFEAEVGSVRVTAGARQEWYRGEVGEEGFDPTLPNAATPGRFSNANLILFNVGAVWDVASTTQIFGGFSQGAEITQLGRAARGIRVPSRVSPEPATSDQFEVGIRRRAGPIRFEFAGFYSTSQSASLLQADPSCAGQALCPLIPLRAPQRFHGFEAMLEADLTPMLQAQAVVTWQRGKVFDAGLNRFVAYSADVVAPFRTTAALTWRPYANFRAALQATYYGSASFYTPAEQALGFVNTEEQLLLDASVRYTVGAVELFVAASNLLDDRYVNVQNQAFGTDFFYYLAEGRRITLGLRARF